MRNHFSHLKYYLGPFLVNTFTLDFLARFEVNLSLDERKSTNEKSLMIFLGPPYQLQGFPEPWEGAGL